MDVVLGKDVDTSEIHPALLDLRRSSFRHHMKTFRSSWKSDVMSKPMNGAYPGASVSIAIRKRAFGM